MFGPKSRPTATSGKTTSVRIGGQPTSSLKKPTASSASLLAGKSTSRSSIVSDTTASVCSNGTTSRPSASVKPVQRQVSGLSGRTTISRPVKTGPSSISSHSSTVTSSSSSALSSSAAAASSSNGRRVPTLAMSLRDKDQQIKLLIKERDEQKFQAELMARRAEEWEEKFMQSELEKSNVTSEADDEVIELRRLAQELEDENKRLAERLHTSEQLVSDTQFKLDELECDRSELKRELDDKEQLLGAMEQEQRELAQGKPVQQVTTERAISKAKYEREIEELKEKIMGRDEQMIQLRSSLEMRKQEVSNLQAHSVDLERKLKIESERSERHLKRIDEINLELKAAEAKLATKMEESDMYEKQVRQLRQEARTAQEKLEQVSLARKKDVDILHNKLTAARRGSTTPTSPQPYKTPTPQDEIVRLQMEIRDLKDQLIDREAELDCNRRDLDVIRRKMETRTLEVDCNNQELARRCQDLLEQNRQSEDTVKQLLKSTTEHSAQLMRATEDLKEANAKCVKFREEIGELEAKLEEQIIKATALKKDNAKLVSEKEELKDETETLRQQVDSLNEQLSDLCHQLDVQTNTLHKDREALANQLSEQEMDAAQMRHDLATAKQDLRSSRLQTQEVSSERDRLRAELGIKEKYVSSRNDIIETLRCELEDCKKSLAECKQKLEELRQTSASEADIASKEMKAQLDILKKEHQMRSQESSSLRSQCQQLQRQLDESKLVNEEDELKRFDEMRHKHSAELDTLQLKIKDLERQLEESQTATLKRDKTQGVNSRPQSQVSNNQDDTPSAPGEGRRDKDGDNDQKQEDYETQIEFLNSVVVDMQRKCDDYKNRLSQMETMNIMSQFDNLITSSQPPATSRASTLRRQNSTADGSAPQPPQPPPPPPPHQTPKRALQAANVTQGFVTATIERPTRISGRPYCDICQAYDLHHTIYCPKVGQKLASRSEVIQSGLDDNGNNNNNNYCIGNNNVDELFREYEQSLESAFVRPFSSLRRPQAVEKPPRAYCDHCDLFGHTVKSCNALKV